MIERPLMQPDQIKHLIEAGLPDTMALVKGDDGVHFEAIVVSPSFADQTLPQQHRLVYQTLGDRMASGEIHALALKTYTPDAWQKIQHSSSH